MVENKISSPLNNAELNFLYDRKISRDLQDFELITSETISVEEEKETLEKCSKLIILPERYTNVAEIIKIVNRNLNNVKYLLNAVLNEQIDISIVFLNYDNMIDFANILNSIILSFDCLNNDNADINYAILYISEVYYFKKKNQKIYI